eukprot:4968369-Alexandrium_andersonii.AAC.1
MVEGAEAQPLKLHVPGWVPLAGAAPGACVNLCALTTDPLCISMRNTFRVNGWDPCSCRAPA